MVVPFKAEHLNRLILQDAQLACSMDLMADPDYAKSLEEGYSWSLIDGDAVLACGGIAEIWKGRSVAWGLIGRDAGRRFVEIHRNCLAAIRMCASRRVEMTVDAEFAAGNRWAKLLGMTYEGTMKSYTPAGRDCHLYARIK